MPLDEALPIAKQIAEALEAAHEQGIIHRDLKPANIKVRTDGTVKVLDFGLAKAMDQGSGIGDQGSGGAANSPTITTPAMTQAGMILGTAAYMAPEQARGKAVDRRADIWAFGVVLFEMLAGKRPFDGEDMTEVLGAVVRLEPVWEALPPALPARVSQALRLCLRKDPKQRVSDIRDVRLALEGAFETAAPPATTVPTSAAAAPRLPWTVAGIAVAIAIALSAFLYVRSARPAAEAPTIRFEVEAPSAGAPTAISPDGRHLVTLATGRGGATGLWVRSLDQVDPQVLKGTERAGGAGFWSPDGLSIAFFADGKLKKVDLRGTPPQTLCEAPDTNRSGTWNRDGVILFAGGNGPIQRVSAGGGSAQPVTELDSSRGETAHAQPHFLPDGQHFLFLAVTAKTENMAIFAGSLGTKDRTLVMTSDRAAVFAPPHHLLFLRGRTLMTQELDTDRLELRGDSRPIADGVLPGFSASDNGVLAYRRRTIDDEGRQLSMVDRSGKLVEAFGANANYQNPVLSADQQFVAFNRAEQNNDLWITDLVRRTTTRLTFDPGVDDSPVWSPDGARIVFSSNREGGVFNLYEKPSGGGGQEQLLLKSGQPKIASDWSRDGRYVVYTETDAKSGADIWLLPLSGDRKPTEYLRTPFSETQARVSPDGRWLAYRSDESGLNEVYVQSFPKAGSKWQVSVDGGEQPQWRGDGLELFYLSPVADNQFMAVDILSKPADAVFKVGVPKKLFVVNVVTGAVAGTSASQRNSYEVLKDGQRLLLNSSRAAIATEIRPSITVVLNWAAGLGK